MPIVAGIAPAEPCLGPSNIAFADSGIPVKIIEPKKGSSVFKRTSSHFETWTFKFAQGLFRTRDD